MKPHLRTLPVKLDPHEVAQRADELSGAAVLAPSVVARIGVANHDAIAAAKVGVEALARNAAATAAHGLRVNVVAPGLTETPLTTDMLRLPAVRPLVK